MYIAIDLGGTNVRIAAVKELGQKKLTQIERFELTHDYEKDFQKIEQIIEILSGGNVAAIGFGLPGFWDKEKKLLTRSTHLLEWVDKNFYEQLKNKFNCEIYAANDAVVAAYGAVYYDGLENENFLYLTWGTGIGGAKVSSVNGKPVVEKMDRKKYLQEFDWQCGGAGIEKRFNKPAVNLSEDEWQGVMQEFEDYIKDVSKKLGEEKIVLGGGITIKQKSKLRLVAKNLAENQIELKISSLNDEVGLYGGLVLVKNNF